MNTLISFVVILAIAGGIAFGAYKYAEAQRPPVDQCINLDDTQLTVPAGQVRDANGVCKPVTGNTGDVVATQVAATIAARPANPPTGGSTNPGNPPVATVTPSNPGNPAPPPASASGKIGTADFDAIGAVNCYRVEDGNVAGAQLRPHNDLQKPNWSERMDLDGAEGVGVIPKGMMSTVHTAKAYRSPANNVSPVCGKR